MQARPKRILPRRTVYPMRNRHTSTGEYRNLLLVKTPSTQTYSIEWLHVSRYGGLCWRAVSSWANIPASRRIFWTSYGFWLRLRAWFFLCGWHLYLWFRGCVYLYSILIRFENSIFYCVRSSGYGV